MCRINYFQGFELDLSSKKILFSPAISRLRRHFQSCLEMSPQEGKVLAFITRLPVTAANWIQKLRKTHYVLF